MRVAKPFLLLVAVAGVCQSGSAFAAVVNWPATMGGWTKITVGGADYMDKVTAVDNTDSVWSTPLDRIDIVGGLDSTGTSYTAGFWAVDQVNNVLMFRIRSDNPPSPPTDPLAVWTVLINSDGDAYADYALQLDHQFDERVEIGATTNYGPTSSPSWGGVGDLKVATASTQMNVGTIAGYSRFVDATDLATGDGSKFHNSNANDHDYFTDVAIPLSQFELVTGLQPGNTFSVALATSADHVNLNKDKPDGGWSDPIVTPVPEPATMGIAALSGLLLLRRRKD